jgi:hypothetical protein
MATSLIGGTLLGPQAKPFENSGLKMAEPCTFKELEEGRT